ncbi:MAG: cellulase family glycosylhydrolase [Firmicutes bacterium]|nr:cellulase family glycosylhydrolase [Bacillota bacterium]
MDQITVQGRRFVDPRGRERIFHGVNFPMGKTDPPTLEEPFFAKCKELGFNMLRLGPCWSKLEPQPGQYDEEYLKIIDGIFDLSAKYGIYVFLDMHQDLWSDFGVHVGDGAPAWATLDDGYGYTKPKVIWGEGYLWGKGIFRAFDHFWNNDPVYGKGLQEHYADLWRMLALRYGEHPAFFGFDFLNEPHPGTLGGKIFRTLVAKLVGVIALLPGVKRGQALKALCGENTHEVLDILDARVMREVTRAAEGLVRKFEKERYEPFIERMTKAVREATPKGVILMEHNYFCNIGVPFGADFPEGETQGCFSPHAYDFTVDGPLYDHASSERVGFMFEESARAQKRMQAPVLVGEWGSAGSKGSTAWYPHMEYLLDFFDARGWSNTYWAYWHGLFGWESFMAVLCRPYPVAVNGTLENFRVRPSAKTCTLWYTPAPAPLEAPTEIYLPGALESVDAGPGAKISMNGKILQVITKSPKITVRYK